MACVCVCLFFVIYLGQTHPHPAQGGVLPLSLFPPMCTMTPVLAVPPPCFAHAVASASIDQKVCHLCRPRARLGAPSGRRNPGRKLRSAPRPWTTCETNRPSPVWLGRPSRWGRASQRCTHRSRWASGSIESWRVGTESVCLVCETFSSRVASEVLGLHVHSLGSHNARDASKLPLFVTSFWGSHTQHIQYIKVSVSCW